MVPGLKIVQPIVPLKGGHILEQGYEPPFCFFIEGATLSEVKVKTGECYEEDP